MKIASPIVNLYVISYDINLKISTFLIPNQNKAHFPSLLMGT